MAAIVATLLMLPLLKLTVVIGDAALPILCPLIFSVPPSTVSVVDPGAGRAGIDNISIDVGRAAVNTEQSGIQPVPEVLATV